MIEKFQLLKTPTKAFKLILQNLTIIDIICLSLTSTKTRRYLESVKCSVKTLHVQIISDNCYVTAWPVDRYFESSFYITESETSALCFTSLPTEYSSRQFRDFAKVSLRLWLQDFLRIFNPPRISKLAIFGKNEFAQRLVDLFQGFKIGSLQATDLAVVRKLGKHADYLNWNLGGHPPQESLIPNMYRFDARDRFTSKITIDDIMMSNVRAIFLDDMFFSLKQCNQFLKCWIKGSIPNLEYLIVKRSELFEQMYGITINEDNFEERLFKGVPYRKFKTSGPHRFMEVEWNVNLSNGFVIRKKNGQKALIEFKPRSFQFVVPRD